MSSFKLLKNYKLMFSEYDVKFFGKISWFNLIAAHFFKEKFLIKLSSHFDKRFQLNFLAFKFVLIVTK